MEDQYHISEITEWDDEQVRKILATPSLTLPDGSYIFMSLTRKEAHKLDPVIFPCPSLTHG